MNAKDEQIDFGFTVQMQMSTPFTTVEFLLNKEHIETIEVTSYLQMIKSAKEAHVVRKAIQRGIFLGDHANHQFLREVKDNLVDKICKEDNKKTYNNLLQPQMATRIF